MKGIREFAAAGKLQGKRSCVVSTINGDANIAFYQEYSTQNISAAEIPIIAFSIGEGEIAQMDPIYYPKFAGHYVSWNYFMTINNPLNNAFIQRFRSFVKSSVL